MVLPTAAEPEELDDRCIVAKFTSKSALDGLGVFCGIYAAFNITVSASIVTPKKKGKNEGYKTSIATDEPWSWPKANFTPSRGCILLPVMSLIEPKNPRARPFVFVLALPARSVEDSEYARSWNPLRSAFINGMQECFKKTHESKTDAAFDATSESNIGIFEWLPIETATQDLIYAPCIPEVALGLGPEKSIWQKYGAPVTRYAEQFRNEWGSEEAIIRSLTARGLYSQSYNEGIVRRHYGR